MPSDSPCSTLPPPDLRVRLRLATAAAHAGVDAAFASGLGDDAHYLRYLHAMHGALAALEPAWSRWREHRDWGALIAPARAALLRADLTTLGATARAVSPIAVDDEAALLGTLYVIHGSALGARVLRRTRPPEDIASEYLDAVIVDGTRWPAVLTRLHAYSAVGPEADRAAHAACAVFHHIAATLHELGEVHP